MNVKLCWAADPRGGKHIDACSDLVCNPKVFEMELPSYTRQLLMQLNQQRSKGHLCDVVIMVENVLFRAHKNVLAASSSYFKFLVLQDNLITLSTQMVKASVFQQVLDFIYTGQLSPSHHATDQGVCELLRAASYLQLSDLAALCLRILKPCRPGHWSSCNSSSLSTCGHLQVSYSCLSGPTETEESHKEMQDWIQRVKLSKEECVSVNSGLGPRLELTRGSPTSSTVSSLQQSPALSSSNSSNHSLFDSSSAFYNKRLERNEHPSTDSQQTAAHVRPQCSREDCLQGPKRQKVVKPEWKVSSESEDRAEVGQEDLVPKKKPQISGESRSEDEEQNGKGFQNSEQIIAHVASQAAEEPRVKDKEGSFTKTEDQDLENRPSQAKIERTPPDATSPRAQLFSCDVCGKLFTQRGTMTRHKRSHLRIKPFACEECGMRFTRQYRRIEHMRTHSGEKPYECPICGAKFTQQQGIVNHLKIHTRIS